MSEAATPVRRLCLVGASGLVGQAVIAGSVARADVRVVGVARREVPLPEGARMEVLVGDSDQWPALIAAARAEVLVCALGTTRKAAGSDEAFRAVDHDLVLEVAHAARAAGIAHFILVSSVGADRASGNLYLRTKGDVEDAVHKLGFRRLDILRPGLLRGPRRESRPLESLAQVLNPLADATVLHGRFSKFRSITVRRLAEVILALSAETTRGRFIHEHAAMMRVLGRAQR